MAINQKPLIYLNNAATSWPKPPEVLSAITQSLSLPVFGSGRTTGTQGEDYITQAREGLSAFLGGGPPEHLVFTHNATDSLNILISGFLAGKKEECHVLSTALDHNSMLRPLHEFERQHRIRLDIIPFENSSVQPESVEAAIRADTKLMVMTHGSNVLGSVQDIKTIGDILHDQGIYFIVDGAQTAGHLSVNLRDLPADAFVFTGHKGLFGIPGTGGVLHPGSRRRRTCTVRRDRDGLFLAPSSLWDAGTVRDRDPKLSRPGSSRRRGGVYHKARIIINYGKGRETNRVSHRRTEERGEHYNQ